MDQQYLVTIDKIIESKNYADLQKHKTIDLKFLIDNHLLKPLLLHADTQTLKHVIDNALDLNCRSKHNSLLIHYVCESAVLEILKYLLAKDSSIDLESKDNGGMTPILFASRDNPNLDVIKFLVDKGVDLECQTLYQWRPLHYICANQSSEAIHYILSQRVDLSGRVTKHRGIDVDYDFIKLIRLNKSGKV